jgi:hypothetical protein
MPTRQRYRRSRGYVDRVPDGVGLIDDESSAMQAATRNGGLVEGFGGIGGKRILAKVR